MDSRFQVLVALIVVKCLAFGSAEAQWTKQSPIPTDRYLNGVALASPTHVFAAGDDKYLLESTDGGMTWSTDMSADFSADPFYMVYFSDALHGYVTGNNNDAWRTTDGGITWIQMTTVPAGSWSHIDFITPTEGFIGANGALAYTSNGGVSWVVKSGYPTCPVIFGMDFYDTQVGLAGGIIAASSEEGIFKTTNGGVTWTKKLSFSANDVHWVTNLQALAIVGSFIYQSTNAGETWAPLSNEISTGLLSFDQVDATAFVGVSGGGDIWRSTNGGVTWSLVLDGIGDLPATWHVSFYDNLNGFVVGQSGIIYSSKDGGLTWTMMNSGIGIQLYDVEMHSTSFGLAACHNGYILRTTNGGSRWETSKVEVTGQIFGRDESLHGVSIVDDGFAVVAGPGGTVFRTYDGGLTWESIGYPNLPDPFWIEDVDFVSRTEGWVVGLDLDITHTKTIYHTVDGGNTWSLGLNAGGYMFSVDFVDAQHGWIATSGQAYFRTTNGGVTWLSGGLTGVLTTSKMRFINQSDGWVVGWDGFVARSSDGGVQWTVKNIGTTSDHLFGLSIVGPTEVWITGREDFSFAGVVYHTTDNGTTWTREVITAFPYVPYTISAMSTGDVWVGGYGGNILHSDQGVGGIPCSDITSMAARCIGGGTKTIQVRVNLMNNTIHAGEAVTIAIDDSQFTSTIFSNGTHSRASFSVPGWSAGDHVVSLIDPPGCLADVHPTCAASNGITKADPYWDDDAEWTGQGAPQATILLGNYPNPFNPSTSIQYVLGEEAQVTLKIYNTLGQEVATLVNEFQAAGYKTAIWNGKNDSGSPVASGLYIYMLKAGNVVKSERMLLMK